MSWNYRVIRHKGKEANTYWYGLHEVYYTDGKADSCTVKSLIEGYESVSELIMTLRRMLKAAEETGTRKLEILNYEDF